MDEIILPKLSPAVIFVSKDSEFSKNSDILTKHNYKEVYIPEVYIPESSLVPYVAEENKEVIFTVHILKAIHGAQICIDGDIYTVKEQIYWNTVLESSDNIIYNISTNDIIVWTIFSYDYKYIIHTKIKKGADTFLNQVNTNINTLLKIKPVSNDWYKDIQSWIFTTIRWTLIQIKDWKKINLFHSPFSLNNNDLITNPDCYTKLVELKWEFIKPIYIDLDNWNILSYKTETAKELFFDNLLNNKVNRFRKIWLQPSRLFTVNNSWLQKYVLSILSNANIDIETIFKKELVEHPIEYYLSNSNPDWINDVVWGTFYINTLWTIQNNSWNITWSLDVDSSSGGQSDSPF